MRLLAIETSCDETSVAVVEDGMVLSNLVASQVNLHTEYGGVVPELATREHLRNLLPLVEQALKEAARSIASLDAVAATQGPGLPGALMAGFHTAQAIAWALGKPCIGIHHHEAHLYSPWIEPGNLKSSFDQIQPCICLIVSGGHTMLVQMMDSRNFVVLGSTVDDAAGECFDKTAKLIGLPYPGGPEVDRLAASGNPKAYDFPRPMMEDGSFDFSFSGLKTAVRYFLRDNPAVLASKNTVADLCASIQAAIVEVLVHKTIRAATVKKLSCVTAAGGVACNSALRKRLAEECTSRGITLRLSPRQVTTDNAAMIGLLAEFKLGQGLSKNFLYEEAKPSWSLEEKG